jgi:hypothetical protein
MKFDEFTFPHPILGVSDSIQGDIVFDQNIISDENEYKISITHQMNNQDLNRMVKNQEAVFLCEVNCSSTLYRNVFKSYNPTIDFTIKRKDVKGRIAFDCMLISDTHIAEYKNSHAHPDYDDYTFDIEKGDVLAYFGSFSFSADINYQKLKAVSSFMEVIDGGDIKTAIFDLDNPKISVKLPHDEYMIFAKSTICKEIKFTPIIHSSIVLGALLYALANIFDYKERQWAQVVIHRVSTEEEFQHLNLEEGADLPVITQLLLGKPICRLLNGLDSFHEPNNQLNFFDE